MREAWQQAIHIMLKDQNFTIAIQQIDMPYRTLLLKSR